MGIRKIKNVELNEITSYLAGVIIGDGHISNSTKSKIDLSPDYRITIELVDKRYLQEIVALIRKVVTTKSKIITRVRPTKKCEHYYFQFRNKSFYYFLTKDLLIPSGKKSGIVFIPTPILNDSILISHFLAGLFDTDGGIRGKTIGFTSKSEILIIQTHNSLYNLGIHSSKDSWVHRKYNQRYFGLHIHKESVDTFLNTVPVRNKAKLLKSHRHVDVPEWSNGLEDSNKKVLSGFA